SLKVRRFISKMCAGYQGTMDQLPGLYETIRCPTLILWAEHDKHFPVVQAKRLHQTMASSTLEIIPGGTHWMPVTRAERLADSIIGFHARC
ncbi:MAG TPA: alpha/beta hydrolase, partial [Pirellula sp.]|nr:alpha/beta hydrolase [Pirellula sp.]